MTETQLEARQERAQNGALVVSKADDGFRVYSVNHPSHLYLVRQEGERWTCTCPDFEYHQADTTWRCKHILAVAPWNGGSAGEAPSDPAAEPQVAAENAEKPPRKRKAQQDQQPIPPVPVQMIMKRSVSPDGRIDSVSVEFSLPVSGYTNDEIKRQALSTSNSKKEIVGSFLKLNGSKASPVLTQPSQIQKAPNSDGKPVFARLIDIGKVNGKWGERLTLNVQINGRTSRLFGSAKQLAEHIQAAGYEVDPANLEPGLRLNLACRVVTKPSGDGKYLNVEKVLPVGKTVQTGGNHDGPIPY
ncbi:MAG: SWIM zinc finger domain-containing protein [Deltaproteobacteria bacterium]|nr:SWIM zinc finger domain-containing protein [Deltaproteobacteria bacterium]